MSERDFDAMSEDAVEDAMRVRARQAHVGVLAFLWSTHSPQEVAGILRAELEIAEEVGG